MHKTLDQIKREEASRLANVVEALADRLGAFARTRGGRYLLFGSTAKGEIRFDSDIDLLVDFPAESEAEAWRLAEDLCARYRVECDIAPLMWCEPTFVAQVTGHARIFG
jgi:predicted nucleotidyltransferase